MCGPSFIPVLHLTLLDCPTAAQLKREIQKVQQGNETSKWFRNADYMEICKLDKGKVLQTFYTTINHAS